MTPPIFLGNQIFCLRRLVLTWVSISHQSFLGIFYYTLFLIILIIGFGNRKLTHFLKFCKEMDYDSNNVGPSAFAQVATHTMAQVLVMPTVMSILSHLEKSQRSSMD